MIDEESIPLFAKDMSIKGLTLKIAKKHVGLSIN